MVGPHQPIGYEVQSLKDSKYARAHFVEEVLPQLAQRLTTGDKEKDQQLAGWLDTLKSEEFLNDYFKNNKFKMSDRYEQGPRGPLMTGSFFHIDEFLENAGKIQNKDGQAVYTSAVLGLKQRLEDHRQNNPGLGSAGKTLPVAPADPKEKQDKNSQWFGAGASILLGLMVGGGNLIIAAIVALVTMLVAEKTGASKWLAKLTGFGPNVEKEGEAKSLPGATQAAAAKPQVKMEKKPEPLKGNNDASTTPPKEEAKEAAPVDPGAMFSSLLNASRNAAEALTNGTGALNGATVTAVAGAATQAQDYFKGKATTVQSMGSNLLATFTQTGKSVAGTLAPFVPGANASGWSRPANIPADRKRGIEDLAAAFDTPASDAVVTKQPAAKAAAKTNNRPKPDGIPQSDWDKFEENVQAMKAPHVIKTSPVKMELTAAEITQLNGVALDAHEQRDKVLRALAGKLDLGIALDGRYNRKDVSRQKERAFDSVILFSPNNKDLYVALATEMRADKPKDGTLLGSIRYIAKVEDGKPLNFNTRLNSDTNEPSPLDVRNTYKGASFEEKYVGTGSNFHRKHITKSVNINGRKLKVSQVDEKTLDALKKNVEKPAPPAISDARDVLSQPERGFTPPPIPVALKDQQQQQQRTT